MPKVIGMRSPFRLRVEAKMMSDHAHRNANSDTVRIELRLTGSTMEWKTRHVLAPSTFAAWMMSLGMPDMKAVKSITAKGTAMVESATTSPQIVFSQPRRTKMA